MMPSKHWIVAGCLFAAFVARAEPLAVGARLAPFTLEDQDEVARTVDEQTRLILFSRDMKGGKLLKEALSEVEADALASRGAVYVADISGMPKLVARLFALPSMRRRPYPMLLDRDGSTTASLPDVEGRATLIFLERLEIVRIEHVAAAEDVRESLETH
jgi:hypothetical protein